MRTVIRIISVAGLTSALALPLHAQAVGWAAALDIFTKSAELIGNLAKNMHQAYSDTRVVMDDVAARNLDNRMVKIESSMTSLNGEKMSELYDIDMFVETKGEHPSWGQIQSKLTEILNHLGSLVAAINAGGPDFVRVAGIAASSDLLGSLQIQIESYQTAAELPEPRTASDRAALKKISVQMHKITEQVRALENEVEKSRQRITVAH